MFDSSVASIDTLNVSPLLTCAGTCNVTAFTRAEGVTSFSTVGVVNVVDWH